jgi:LCP family protein required for cell wall assembly
MRRDRVERYRSMSGSGRRVGSALRTSVLGEWRSFVARFVVALVVLSVATAGSFGYAYWFASDQILHHTKIAPIKPGVLASTPSTQPANYLIVGSDSRAFVHDPIAAAHFGTSQYNSGQRSDTIMIAHVDPNSPGKGFLVSIPRDTWVNIPSHGSAKINAAYNYGPTLLIETIKQNFGVDINHYLEVGFDTFAQIVNAIGAVHIFFPTQARDIKTGLSITTPGCVALDGLKALAYVRSRYYEYRSSSTSAWQPDNTYDFGRIRRQQYFIRSLAQEAISKGTHNPFTAKALLEKTVPYLTRDSGMSLSDFLSLVRAFRSVDPGAVQMVTVPTVRQFIQGQDAQVIAAAQAAPIFARLGTFTTAKPTKASPLPKIPHAQIRVQVLNGSGVRGAAAATTSALSAAGFASGGPAADADRHDYAATEIRYAPGDLGKARVVASYLGGVGKLVGLPDASQDAPIIVVIGSDFQSVTTLGSHPTPTTTTTTVPPNPGTTPGVTAAPTEAGRPPVGCG